MGPTESGCDPLRASRRSASSRAKTHFGQLRDGGCRTSEAVVDVDICGDQVIVHLRGRLGARSAAALSIIFEGLSEWPTPIHVHTSRATAMTREVLAVVADAQLSRRNLGLSRLQLCPVDNRLHDLMPATWSR